MRYTDLFRRDTRLTDVSNFVSAYEVAAFERDATRTQRQHERRMLAHGLTILLSVIFAVALCVSTQWAVWAFIVGFAIVAAAALYRRFIAVAVGYGTWLLFHYGLIVWGAALAVSVALAFITFSGGWLTLALLAAIGFALSGVIVVIRQFSHPRSAQYEEDNDYVPTVIDEVYDQLLTALSDHYTPRANFIDILKPTRSQFEMEWEYVEALQNYEAAVNERKRQVVADHIHCIYEDEKTDGVVVVELETTNEQTLLREIPRVNSILHAHGITEDTTRSTFGQRKGGYVILRINTAPQPDALFLLTTPVDAEKFFAENPCTDPYNIPAGLTPRQTVWNAPLHHSVIVGRTGSGKGSLFQTYLYQLMPFIAAGLVRVWMVDPKPAEMLPYINSGAIYRMASEEDEIVALIQDYHSLMLSQRSRSDIGRSNPYTVDNPIELIMIDEGASVLDDKAITGVKDEEGRTIVPMLKAVNRKGRSLNFFHLMFTQEITSDPIGVLPKNMPIKMGGYVESRYEMAKALGLTDEQLDAYPDIIFPIPQSTKSNGYRYAGIFNVIDSETNERTSIRVPFVSDEMIAKRLAEFGLDKPPAPVALGKSAATHRATADVVEAQDDDADFEAVIASLQLPD